MQWSLNISCSSYKMGLLVSSGGFMMVICSTVSYLFLNPTTKSIAIRVPPLFEDVVRQGGGRGGRSTLHPPSPLCSQSGASGCQ